MDAKELELIEARDEAVRKLDEARRKWAEAYREEAEAYRKWDEADSWLWEYRESKAQQGGQAGG